MAGQPKAPFYFAVLVVVGGLIAFSLMRSGILNPNVANNGHGPPEPISNPPQPNSGNATGGTDVAPPTKTTGDGSHIEDPQGPGITTVEEWKFVAAEKLPPVKGTSDYAAMKNNTVRFALNVWAGWAPIALANQGKAPNKVWKTRDGKEFKVELVVIDDPITMLNTYVAGQVHAGWGTLDMLPLFMERMVDKSGAINDSRAMPRVFQQVDWSAGGDGIVVRDAIKEVRDLRRGKDGKKKTVTLAANSPSHYFVLNMLVAAGVQPDEVNFKFTQTAFEAAAAFNSDKTIDACVSWAPDIYKLTEVPGNRMLVNTQTANRLIADVWFARADFARDHYDICEGLTRGIFAAMEEMKTDAGKKQAAHHLATVFEMKDADVEGMLGDAYSTGWGDNYQFFVNKNNLANFERVWNNSYNLYRRIGVIGHKRVSFDQVMDNTIIRKLGEEPHFAAQKPAQHFFAPASISAQDVEKGAFLTATHFIHFFPNSSDLHKKVMRNEDGMDREVLYDPNVEQVLEKIGTQIAQFELSRIAIEGHTDSSMRGQVDASLVKELSQLRANAVKEAMVAKYDLDPNRFTVIGHGWDKPANADSPQNHSQNRRVEVRILPAEGQ